MKKAVSVVIIIVLLAIAVIVLYFLQGRKNSNDDPIVPKPVITNCPKFIDCMPGPGRTAKCEVPKGCENITEIAY